MAKNGILTDDRNAISIEFALNDVLGKYTEEQLERALKIMKEVANETARELKQVSPETDRSGQHYANGWSVKKAPGTLGKTGGGYIVYNRLKPGLTHLLEHGHTTNKGTGRGQIIHIAPVEEEKNNELLQRLEAEL